MPSRLAPGFDASWPELVGVLGDHPQLSAAWMQKRTDAVVYHRLPIHFSDGRLAVQFVRCRYGPDGPRWMCRFVDPGLASPLGTQAEA